MAWILVGVILIVGIMMAASNNSKNEKALHGQASENANWKKHTSVRMEDPQNTDVYNKLIEIYKSGEPLFGNSVASEDEVKSIFAKIKAISNEHDYDFISAIQMTLMIGRNPSDTASSEGIQLRSGEKCYFKTKNSILNTVQKVLKNINYAGLRYNVGAFRMGNISLAANDIEGFRPFAAGNCYVTNQRIVFTSDANKNKVINVRDILSFVPYEENAVLINIENATPVIVNFPCNGMFNITSRESIVLFNDDTIAFMYALATVLGHKEK